MQYDIEAGKTALIRQYQEKGLLVRNDVTMIKHPASDYMSHYCTKRLKTLILQVTQQCNLRCSYCTFGGLYYNRQHSAQRMSFETAQKAIDFFLSNSMETESIHFGFYGGEPLLEFDLIKQCVTYFGKTVEGKKVTNDAYLESMAGYCSGKYEIPVEAFYMSRQRAEYEMDEMNMKTLFLSDSFLKQHLPRTDSNKQVAYPLQDNKHVYQMLIRILQQNLETV